MEERLTGTTHRNPKRQGTRILTAMCTRPSGAPLKSMSFPKASGCNLFWEYSSHRCNYSSDAEVLLDWNGP